VKRLPLTGKFNLSVSVFGLIIPHVMLGFKLFLVLMLLHVTVYGFSWKV